MISKLLSSLTMVVALAGCSLHHAQTNPASPVTVPSTFEGVEKGGQLDAANEWWRTFGDDALDEIVRKTVAQNLDIRRAWARLSQARAIARQTGAALLPQIDASATVGVSQGVNPLKDLPGEDDFVYPGTFSLGVTVGYEVDLWGRVRSTRDAASYDVAAARQDVGALALVMSAQAVEAWLSIAEAKAQLALIEQQQSRNETYLKLLEERFKFGQADSVSIFQQRQALARSIAQVPLIRARVKLLKYQLAILQGNPAGAFKAEPAAALPQLAALPATGLPAEVLRNRPDVKAAQMRLVAADHRVGAAIADQYPALRLSGGTGLQSTDIADFITGWVWNLLANLVAPLFDGGRRAAEVERSRAVVTDLVHAYGSTILGALKEVEDALVQEAHQRRYIDRLQRQIGLADATLGEARTRYLEGGGDYLSVLNALAAKQSVELSLLSARRTILSYRVALHRALGGSWTNALKEPAPVTPSSPPDATMTPPASSSVPKAAQ